MHRADREVVNQIERTLRDGRFIPVQGQWPGPRPEQDRCALAALLTGEQAVSPFSHQAAADLLNRSEAWIGFFVSAFDQWPVVNDHVFTVDGYSEEYGERSRGYRAGWECARRVLGELGGYRAAG